MFSANALNHALSRIPTLPQDFYSRPMNARLNATTVSGLASLEQIQQVITAVNQTLADGGTFADFKRLIRQNPDLLVLPDHRLDNIFRTNIQTAYNRSRREQQEQDQRRVYWRYSAINDVRTRPLHRQWNGTVLHRDHPWWRTHYPPCGYRCFLPETVIQGDLRGAIRRKYFGIAVEIFTVGGKTVRLTGNHPVLSSRGWIRADMLNSGDNLLSYSNPVHLVDVSGDAVKMDNDQAVTSAKNLFEAIWGQTFAFADGSSLKFNGDLFANNCEVEIDVNQSGLMIKAKSKFGTGTKQEFFVGRNNPCFANSSAGGMTLHFAGDRDFVFSEDSGDIPFGCSGNQGQHIAPHVRRLIKVKDLALQVVIRFPGGLPGSSALASDATRSLFDGLPLDQFRLATVADDNAMFSEYSIQGRAADAGLYGYLLEAYAGLVGVDPVLSIRKFDFSGHVYDFQSTEGVVIADGIVAHNCRCSVISLTHEQASKMGITEDDSLPDGQPDAGWSHGPEQSELTQRDLLSAATKEAAVNHPSAVDAIQQFERRNLATETAADALDKALPDLSPKMLGKLPDAVDKAVALGVTDPSGLLIAAEYLEGKGSDLNNLIVRAERDPAVAIAATTIKDSLKVLKDAAPNRGVVDVTVSAFDVADLHTGTVFQLGSNLVGNAGLTTTATTVLRFKSGGVNLSAFGFDPSVLLLAGSVYQVEATRQEGGLIILVLALSSDPPTTTFYPSL